MMKPLTASKQSAAAPKAPAQAQNKAAPVQAVPRKTAQCCAKTSEVTVGCHD